MATPYSNILAWKISWTEEPGRLPSMGLWTVRCYWARTEISRMETTQVIWGCLPSCPGVWVLQLWPVWITSIYICLSFLAAHAECGILVSWPGTDPCSLQRKCGVLTTGPPLFVLFFKIFIVYWSTDDTQLCVSFRGTAKWFSYTYTHNHAFSNLFPI